MPVKHFGHLPLREHFYLFPLVFIWEFYFPIEKISICQGTSTYAGPNTDPSHLHQAPPDALARLLFDQLINSCPAVVVTRLLGVGPAEYNR